VTSIKVAGAQRVRLKLERRSTSQAGISGDGCPPHFEVVDGTSFGPTQAIVGEGWAVNDYVVFDGQSEGDITKINVDEGWRHFVNGGPCAVLVERHEGVSFHDRDA
jgi:hypothetical protein